MFIFRRWYILIAFAAVAVLAAGCRDDVVVESPAADVVRNEIDQGPASPSSAASETVLAEGEGTENGTVADSAPTVVPVRSRVQQSASDNAGSVGSLRDVDFYNGFTYDSGSGFDTATETVTVENGSFENGEFGDTDYYWFGVTDVEFGDLDGDGIEDALVATGWSGGGSGFFDSVTAYRLVDGQVASAGRVHFGDRAHGGIYDVRIVDGAAQVWSFSTTLGACCPNRVTQNNLVLGEYFLTQTDRGVTRTWMAPGPGDQHEELKFIAGTGSAAVAIYGRETEVSFTFEAAQDQVLTLALVDGPAPAVISVIDLSTGQVMSGLAAMSLPSDSLYEVVIEFDAARSDTTTLDVIIGVDDQAPPVTWTSAVEQVQVTAEPFVTTSLVWPVFESSQPGTDAANAALASFVTALDDSWIEDVTEFSDPLDDSSFDVNYEVLLATPEIVSVRFNFFDYVCCRPYPNYGHWAAVLDLRSGDLLTVDQIIDGDRLDEVISIWLNELDTEGMLPGTVDEVLAQNPRFDSLALTPVGLEFGTGRNAFGGGTIGSVIVVPYVRLGDLVNPELLARLSAS